MPRDSAVGLERSIAQIDGFDRGECMERWQTSFGRPPPKHLSVPFMKRVLIWDIQNDLLGGVSAKTERRLSQIASGKKLRSKAKPGSHPVREWHGRTYQVGVTSDGYVLDGKTWRSLSAIARQITGAHWSGPRFFGVE